ncbi:MAG: hypothetical protein ACKO4A_16890, partial [Gammaproteobacteria bacterium]
MPSKLEANRQPGGHTAAGARVAAGGRGWRCGIGCAARIRENMGFDRFTESPPMKSANRRIRPTGLLLVLGLWALAAAAPVAAGAAAKRALLIDDFDRFRSVEDPQCSPDGKWIAYTVSASDVATDSRRSSL